jgi:hypothetical protein
MIYFSLTTAGYSFLAAEALAAQFDFAAVFPQGADGASNCYTNSMN